MPWRVLGVRKAASLPVAETGPAEWLLLKIGGKDVAAMPVLKRAGGLLLEICLGALTPAQLEANSVAGVTEDLGPVTTVIVEGYVEEEGSKEAVEVEMHLLDWPQSLELRVGTENPPWPQDTIFPRNENEMVRTVNIDQLATLAREWVQTGDNAISEAYATAVEGPPKTAAAGATEELLQQLLNQMQATAATVATLQSDMEHLRHAEPADATPWPGCFGVCSATSGDCLQDTGFTCSWHLASRPGSGALATAGPDEVVEVDEEREPSTDQLKAALTKLLESSAKPKKSKATGDWPGGIRQRGRGRCRPSASPLGSQGHDAGRKVEAFDGECPKGLRAAFRQRSSATSGSSSLWARKKDWATWPGAWREP